MPDANLLCNTSQSGEHIQNIFFVWGCKKVQKKKDLTLK